VARRLAAFHYLCLVLEGGSLLVCLSVVVAVCCAAVLDTVCRDWGPEVARLPLSPPLGGGGVLSVCLSICGCVCTQLHRDRGPGVERLLAASHHLLLLRGCIVCLSVCLSLVVEDRLCSCVCTQLAASGFADFCGATHHKLTGAQLAAVCLPVGVVVYFAVELTTGGCCWLCSFLCDSLTPCVSVALGTVGSAQGLRFPVWCLPGVETAGCSAVVVCCPAGNSAG
jgi:hypothetical protein